MAVLASNGSGNMTDGPFPSYQMNNGGNHYMTSGDLPLDGVTSFSIGGTQKKQVTTNIAIFGSKGTSTTNQLYLAFENGRVRCCVSNGSQAYGDYTMANDTSEHTMLMVYDGNGSTNADKVKLWVDGTQQTLTFTGTIPSTAPTNANNYDVGRYYPSGAAVYCDAFVSHSYVFSDALDGTDASTLYNSGNGVKDASVAGTLIAGWLFNEGSGSTIYDYAPSVNSSAVGYNGTTSGGTWDLATSLIGTGSAAFATTILLSNDSTASSYTVTTTPTNSSTFNIASTVTYDAVLVHVNTVAVSPSGTFTLSLRNTTDSVNERTVTVNVADLPYHAATSSVRGWYAFEFSSSYTGVTGKNYAIQMSTSVSSQISLYGTSTTATSVSLYGRKTTTQLPMIGDSLLITGDYTGQGTGSDHVIVMNDFTPKAYGTTSAPNQISGRGSIKFGNTDNKKYYFRQKGVTLIEGGGKVATNSTPSSSCRNIWDFDVATNVDSGFRFRAGSGDGGLNGPYPSAFKTKLTADASSSATVLTVASTTGWAAGDTIAIGATTRTQTQAESRTIASVDSSTQVTITSGLTNAHSGTSPAQANVFNLTRLNRIGGESSSLQAFIDIEQYAGTVDFEGIEFYWLGSATASSRGIDIKTGYGTKEAIFTGCSFRDFVVASSVINASGSAYDRVKFEDCVAYNCPANFLVTSATTGANNYIINSGWMLTASGVGLSMSDAGWSFQGDNVVSSTNGVGVSISESGGRLGSNSGTLEIQSCGGQGLTLTSVRDGVMPTISSWRNSSDGISLSAVADVTLPLGYVFGNTTGNLAFTASCGSITFKDGSINGDTTFATTNGYRESAAGVYTDILFENVNFGTATGILTTHTNDLNVAVGYHSLALNYCKLSSSTELSGQSNINAGSVISSQDHDRSAGSMKFWTGLGIGTSDTAIYAASSPSLRMTPSSTAAKTIADSRLVKINSGTTKTVSVKVRLSLTSSGDAATYNGAYPRLMLKYNRSLGSSWADEIVLDTATSSASGAFETLTGTTPTASTDGAFQVYVDCDGTTGWVNIDDWSVT